MMKLLDFRLCRILLFVVIVVFGRFEGNAQKLHKGTQYKVSTGFFLELVQNGGKKTEMYVPKNTVILFQGMSLNTNTTASIKVKALSVAGDSSVALAANTPIVQTETEYTTGYQDLHKKFADSLFFYEEFSFFIAALTLPCKIRTAPLDISTVSSLGSAFGCSFSLGRGTILSVAGFAGPVILPVVDPKGNNSQTLNLPGGTLALGVTARIWDFGYIGVFYGADYLVGADEFGKVASSGVSWNYHAKPWLSFAIGVEFLRF